MFDLEILQWSTKVRSGYSQYLAEAVATAGLIFVILRSGGKASTMVASYIGAAYWFTASTSFANPAAVFGRMMSNTFAGIHPGNALHFVTAEVIGAFLGLALYHSLGSGSDHNETKA
jgi:glycerol uptake facilitator-like aquaporin